MNWFRIKVFSNQFEEIRREFVLAGLKSEDVIPRSKFIIEIRHKLPLVGELIRRVVVNKNLPVEVEAI